MKRITATNVYAYLECPRAVALDLSLPRDLRRPPQPHEEFVRRRGREFEARFVAGLDPAEPSYPDRDWQAGAQATLGLLREGAELVFQGVLLGEHRLGIPDLMRRVQGESRLGGHHYEVADIKSSRRPRGDQILQVVFYSRLLAEVQGRMPESGALVLKDGREERFALQPFLPAALQAEEEILALREDPERARPFFGPACAGCHWNHRCLPEMEANGDLSLVQGMTPGARELLEAAGCRDPEALASWNPDSRRSPLALDGAWLRRLVRGAQARLAGRPLREPRPKGTDLPASAILLHLLVDPYAERVLWIGALPLQAGAEPIAVRPESREQEWDAFHELVRRLPEDAPLLHCGAALPRWYEEQAWQRQASPGLEERFVDLLRRLRAAATFPAPVFGLYDLVQHGLGVDPHRHGHAGAAALWAEEEGGRERLCRKGAADLADLARLAWDLLGPESVPVAIEPRTGARLLDVSHRRRSAVMRAGDPALSLEQRLLRFLAREEEDERRSFRDLRSQPVEERVLDGECIQGAVFEGFERGSYRFTVSENLSKFRAGDAVAVGDGLDLDNAQALVYGSYRAETGVLLLERDPYARGAVELEPGLAYCIDRRALGLRGRLVDVVGAAFSDPLLAEVLDGEHRVQCDAARRDRALRHLAETGLNEAQARAGAAAIGSESLALVQGPPGTGKTRLLAEVVGALCGAGCRLVLCAFTNRAIDHALLAIRSRAPGVALAKVGSARGGSGRALRGAGIAVLDARRSRLPETGVVAGTCFQLAKLGDRERFHFAVFDEAGQLPIPHALAGMLRAKRWIFFGDHRQLPPVITAHHADGEVKSSVFEHLHCRYGSELLDVTYRMNDGVCAVVGEAFYDGRLRPALEVASRRLPFAPGGALDEVLDPERPVVLARVDHCQPGMRSREEAELVGDLVSELLRRHRVPAEQIAVIAPFRAQVRQLRSALQRRRLPGLERLTVDTVERIQGQEREVVLLSMAVGEPASLRSRTSFFFSANRINVAISRARTKVVIVASGRVFEALPKDVDGLRVASLLKALRARLPEVDLTPVYCGGRAAQPRSPRT